LKSRQSSVFSRQANNNFDGRLNRFNVEEKRGKTWFPTDVVIVAGARDGWCGIPARFGVSAIDLARTLRAEVVNGRARTRKVRSRDFCNVMQTSADALYGARHVALKPGLKMETPAVTVNRLCGSGIEAIAQAAQRLLLGEAELVWRADGKHDAGGRL